MDIFSADEQEKIVQAISLAENGTSGEIRLVVEASSGKRTAWDAALAYFQKLDMHKTVRRNGVLIYLAVDDHAFAIAGDKGIDEKVPEDFWEATKEEMAGFFGKGEIVEGLVAGIRHAGEELRHFFPKTPDDVNELPNDIYFGKTENED